MSELSDEQAAFEKRLREGVPRINIGALFLPPVWGPAHGIWSTILFYPIWLFADNSFYAAYSQHTLLSIVIAALVFASLTAGTVAFSIISQHVSLIRAVDKGMSKSDYLKRERKWSIVCVIVGVVMLVAATYYNVVIRPHVGM